MKNKKNYVLGIICLKSDDGFKLSWYILCKYILAIINVVIIIIAKMISVKYLIFIYII